MSERKRSRPVKGGFQLIVEPDNGIGPVTAAIDKAEKSVDIVIFRFDRADVEKSLVEAVRRGVTVQALIACTNRGGERNLRRLETRLLAAGVTVSRTASDLCRYHGKMLIVDKAELHILAFNFTRLDVDRSRSFGIVTRSETLVHEACRLFEADSNRRPYLPEVKTFLVSPVNARDELAEFIGNTKEELLIYDPGLGDSQMLRLLEERIRAGVKVRLLGTLRKSSSLLHAYPLMQLRLHTRTIVRDGHDAFIGSQSLRAPELDGRREIGILFTDRKIAHAITKVFEEDWKLAAAAGEGRQEEHLLGDKLAKKVAKAIAKDLPPVSEVIASIADGDLAKNVNLDGVNIDGLEETIRKAVKTVVKETIQDAVGS